MPSLPINQTVDLVLIIMYFPWFGRKITRGSATGFESITLLKEKNHSMEYGWNIVSSPKMVGKGPGNLPLLKLYFRVWVNVSKILRYCACAFALNHNIDKFSSWAIAHVFFSFFSFGNYSQPFVFETHRVFHDAMTFQLLVGRRWNVHHGSNGLPPAVLVKAGMAGHNEAWRRLSRKKHWSRFGEAMVLIYLQPT